MDVVGEILYFACLAAAWIVIPRHFPSGAPGTNRRYVPVGRGFVVVLFLVGILLLMWE